MERVQDRAMNWAAPGTRWLTHRNRYERALARRYALLMTPALVSLVSRLSGQPEDARRRVCRGVGPDQARAREMSRTGELFLTPKESSQRQTYSRSILAKGQ